MRRLANEFAPIRAYDFVRQTVHARVMHWLRALLAVLALLSNHPSVMQAALGTTCPHVVVANAADVAMQGGAELKGAVAADRSYDTNTDVPALPVAPLSCGTTAVTVPTASMVPAVGIALDSGDRPSGPVMRPVSVSPPPPFHPPRAI